MKKTFVLLLAISTCFFACKKGDQPQVPKSEEREKIPVSLNLLDFIQQTESIPVASGRKSTADNKRDSTLKGKVTDVYYLVFDSYGGYNARFVHQQFALDSANFGKLNDTLYTGDYTFILMASNSPLNFTLNELNGATINSVIGASNLITPFKDVFYKKLTLSIGKGFYPPQHLALNRVVGNLQVEVLDANVNAGYQVTVVADGENPVTPLGTLNFIKDPFDNTHYHVNMPKVSGVAFSNNFINTTGELTLTITAKNNATGDQIQRVIEHVKCYKNKKTTVTGSLNIPGAPESKTKDFQISVNDDWSPNDNIIGF